jgi:hypothetical protein
LNATEIFQKFQSADKVGKLSEVPTLFVSSRNDSVVPSWMMDKLYDVGNKTKFKLSINLDDKVCLFLFFKNYRSYGYKYRIKIETGTHIRIWNHRGLAEHICKFMNEVIDHLTSCN